MSTVSERVKELIALELYGELGEAERAELVAALRDSESAREYSRAMRRGLGRLPRAEAPTRPAEELDPGWHERLRRSMLAESARGRAEQRIRAGTAAVAAAVGFAAGVLLMVGLGGGSYRPAADPLAESPPLGFERATAPPPAQVASPLARLGEYLGR